MIDIMSLEAAQLYLIFIFFLAVTITKTSP